MSALRIYNKSDPIAYSALPPVTGKTAFTILKDLNRSYPEHPYFNLK